MSKRVSIPVVEASKKYAKHLFNLLKKTYPDISYNQCLEIVAKLQGAMDWSTYNEASGMGFRSSFNPLPRGNMLTTDELNAFLREHLLVRLREEAAKNGLRVRNTSLPIKEESGYDSCTEILGQYVGEIRYWFIIEPEMYPSVGDCSLEGYFVLDFLNGKVEESVISLTFPADAGDVAFRILNDARLVCDDKSIRISISSSDVGFPYILELPNVFRPFFGGNAEDGKNIETDKEVMACFWRWVLREFKMVAAIFKAYTAYVGKWHDERAIKTFIEKMGDVLSGEPRYRQVSTTFYETTINSRRIYLFLGYEGPLIGHESLESGSQTVALDRAKIKEFDLDDDISKVAIKDGGLVRYERIPGFYIAKYGHSFEAHILLGDLTNDDFAKMEKQLGAIVRGDIKWGVGFDIFPKSEAFQSLKEWMKKNPKYAREFQGKHPWYDAALQQSGVIRKEKRVAVPEG